VRAGTSFDRCDGTVCAKVNPAGHVCTPRETYYCMMREVDGSDYLWGQVTTQLRQVANARSRSVKEATRPEENRVRAANAK
jgi:hypothetical protein